MKITKKEDAVQLYNNIVEWIKLADTKASIMLAFEGAIFVYLLNQSTFWTQLEKAVVTIGNNKPTFDKQYFLYLLIISCFITFLLSLYKLVQVLVPDLIGWGGARNKKKSNIKEIETERRAKYPANAPQSDLFFGYIQTYGNAQLFVEKVGNIKKKGGKEKNPCEIAEEYLKQVYINSVIVFNKFNNFKWAMRWLGIACFFAVVYMILLKVTSFIALGVICIVLLVLFLLFWGYCYFFRR